MSETASGDAAGASVLLASRLRLSMIRLSRQLRRGDPSDLTITQVSALATVVRSGPISVGHLAEIERLPSPAATRLADKLEDAGLISRRANPADRRSVQLVASAAGVALIERRTQVRDSWLAERLRALSETDRLAIERAVAVLESFATERPGEPSAISGDRPGAEEARA